MSEPETNHGARILNVKIRDQHADVDMSFWTQSANSFTGEVDNILYVEQCPMKLVDSYLVI